MARRALLLVALATAVAADCTSSMASAFGNTTLRATMDAYYASMNFTFTLSASSALRAAGALGDATVRDPAPSAAAAAGRGVAGPERSERRRDGVGAVTQP